MATAPAPAADVAKNCRRLHLGLDPNRSGIGYEGTGCGLRCRSRGVENHARPESCTLTIVIGFYIIIAVLLLFPIGFLASTTFAAGIIGWALQSNAELANEDSELLECNY